MLQCTETITLVKHIAEQSADSYTCTIIQGASWYAKVKTALEGHGLVAAREVRIRIPEANLPAAAKIAEGDFVVRGEVTTINRQADLEPYESIRVMVVSDNLRGVNPHIGVMGQ